MRKRERKRENEEGREGGGGALLKQTWPDCNSSLATEARFHASSFAGVFQGTFWKNEYVFEAIVWDVIPKS